MPEHATRATWRARFAPTTRLGRIACWLGLAALLWFVMNQLFIGLGQTIEPGPALVPMIVLSWVGLGTGVVASALALVALTRRGERGVAVLLCLLPGAFALFLVLGELLIPH